jgi:hypothetical protein
LGHLRKSWPHIAIPRVFPARGGRAVSILVINASSLDSLSEFRVPECFRQQFRRGVRSGCGQTVPLFSLAPTTFSDSPAVR